MKATTAALLARPAAAADRHRFVLIAASTAAAGGLLLAGARIARLRATDVGGYNLDRGLSPYVNESGLRPGVVFGVALLALPILVLAVQALRVGSVARDRRMASLRLAGATPHDVRTVAAAEAGGAALVGGLFAGWVYLLLWVLLGVLPPTGLRMLPAPDVLDIAFWVLLAVLAGAGGALAGAAVQGRVVAEPLGVFRGARSHEPGLASLMTLVAGVALVVGGVVVEIYAPLVDPDGLGLMTGMLGLPVAAIAGGPRLVRTSGRLLRRRRGAEDLLAGWRLEADPRSAGRVAGVLVICGLALAIEVTLAADALLDESLYDRGFYLTGIGLATAGTVVAAGVAVLTLLIGAADQLLDARRPLATLAALGVDESALVRVLSRQLSTAAVPAVMVGVLIAGLLMGLSFGVEGASSGALRYILLFVVPTVVTALFAGVAVSLVARLATQLLRPRLRAAIDPENLRVA